jgi:hypothetical protein
MFQKNLTVHSEDRDRTKYPHASHFAFEAPVDYKNIVSLRLSDIYVPPLYTFSECRNNLTFFLNKQLVTISPGNYTIDTMIRELIHVTKIGVLYDDVRNTILFESSLPFILDFTNKPIASSLGFTETKYVGIQKYKNYHIKLEPNAYYLEAPFPYSFQGDPYVYMELDFFNSMDELTPYPRTTTKHNLAFAKIPRIPSYVNKDYLTNTFYSDPPLERVQKFQCRFRYHDGTLVEFGIAKFSFTIEVTMKRSDLRKLSLI